MKRLLCFCLCVCFLITQSGCASIVSGSTQDVSIRSNPAGAAVLINGMSSGTTPLTTDLKRKKRHQITIQKDGYLEEKRTTKRGFNWWYAGNIIFGGIIGLIVDPCTGAMYKVEPEEINVTLVESGGQATVQSNSNPESAANPELKSLGQEALDIEGLVEMKKQGLITEEEFTAKKKKILGI